MEDCSPINHLTAEAPPVFLYYPGQSLKPRKDQSDDIRIINFGLLLKKKMDALKVECQIAAGWPQNPSPRVRTRRSSNFCAVWDETIGAAERNSKTTLMPSPFKPRTLDIGCENTESHLSEKGDTHMDRRGFVQNVAAVAVGGATCLRGGQASETVAAAKPRRATLAQVVVHKNVEQNLANARRALSRPARKRPISYSSQSCFSPGVSAKSGRMRWPPAWEIAELCRKFAVTALVGTGWKEEDKLFNQVRIIDAKGALAGVYAKKCLTYGDAKMFPRHDAARVRLGRLDCGSSDLQRPLGDPRFHRRPKPAFDSSAGPRRGPGDLPSHQFRKRPALSGVSRIESVRASGRSEVSDRGG